MVAHRHRRFDRSDGAEELEAARPFHHHVGEDEVDLGRRLDHLERLRRVRRRLRAVAALLAQDHDRVRLEGVVLDEQQPDHVGPGVNAGFGAGCIAISDRSADGRRAWLATAFRSWRFCFFDELSDASDFELRREDLAAALPLDELDVSRDTSLACRCSCSVTRRSLIHAERGTRRRRTATSRSCAKPAAPRPRALLERPVVYDASALGARAVCIFGG